MTMKAIGNKKLNIYVNINICKNKTQKGKLIQKKFDLDIEYSMSVYKK